MSYKTTKISFYVRYFYMIIIEVELIILFLNISISAQDLYNFTLLGFLTFQNGKELSTVVSRELSAGDYQYKWDSSNL